MRLLPAWVVVVVGLVVACGGHVAGVSAQQKEASLSSGWVGVPADGATSARAYAVVENPTMYAFYVMKASSNVSGSVELRQTAKDVKVEHFMVPAYGSLDMNAEGFHLLLTGLKKPLAAGDKVNLTVVTDDGAELSVEAVVKKP
jgi:copper(I)-binding protein